jgi:chromosome segregation ATPase
MKQFILKNKKVITGTIAMLLIGAVTMSFQDSPFAYSKFSVQEDITYGENCSDTVPGKETMKMKDFEKLQTDLDKSLLQVNEELKKLDLTNLQKEIEASLKDADMDKIRKEIELAVKSIDMDKMLADLGSSLKNLNLDYKSTEIEKALAEAGKEIEKAKLEIKEIDREAIKMELEKAEKEIEKSKLEISKIDLDKIITEASAGIDKAKAELKETRNMFTEMENEGLINSKNGFTIEYKNKDLYIDGKKQSEKTTDKYRKYFKQDHFKITIDKE